MIATMDAYAGLPDVRIEGIEPVAVRYKNLVEAAKKKSYDVLDHRKQDVINFEIMIVNCAVSVNLLHMITSF
jgi:hypothetical protein